MKILRHRLHLDGGKAVPFERSPNAGGRLEPKYLVMHYTGGSSADGSIQWLCDPAARASAHLVIGRDGSITQLVPFDRVAWHAGASQWEGLSGLNAHSIGIELDNAGRLQRKGGRWRAWFGTAYDDDQVMEATHKHESEPSGWQLFPEAQIDAAIRVAKVLMDKYELRDIVGHDDISPGRKVDPGPAFPLAQLRARLAGRGDDRMPVYEATTHLNIRSGPGADHPRLPEAPLAPGTRLEVAGEDGRWRLVYLLDERAGEAGEAPVEGWVHGNYIRRLD